ncbi:hypothetical protein BJV74DRAFT_846109 [Russula compacta]|nr:hypothetical protein BJV74DRAFT_846109 [Russula compacta]
MVTLSTSVVLLFVALLGLFRLRRHGGGRFGLVLLLWKQGLIWFALAIAAELPVGVSIILDLGYARDIMLQPPAAIVMSIAATRMHRALVDFAFGSTDKYTLFLSFFLQTYCDRMGL